MLMKGYDQDICPLIQEVRYYEMRDKTVTRQMMRQLNTLLVEWLYDKHEYINFDEEGRIINDLPPILTELYDQISFVREVLQRKRENRFIPYDIQQTDMELIEEYARNYSYYYMNGNETTTILGCTHLFRDLVSIFDHKAGLYS